MKALAILIAAFAALSLSLPLAAQQGAPALPKGASPAPSDPSLDLTPAPPGQILPPPVTPELTLIPEQPGAIYRERDKLERAAVKSKTKTEVAEEALLTKVRYRQARTRVLTDPIFPEEWHKAQIAKTEYAKRDAYKRYYTLLFDRMAKIDPRIKAEIDLRRKLALHRLEQHRVTPTVALEADKEAETPDEWSSNQVMFSLDPFTPAAGSTF